MPNSKGKITVKRAWDLMRQMKEIQQDIMLIWETGIPFGAAGVQGPFIQMKKTIYQRGECNPKLKSLFRSVPIFIIWQIWKKRNRVKHGGNMSR
ncbi:hypothetical protein H5410_046010 [Solanum commersonii]|uniref:Uncharacterized protein n=1 Tax=Solanum commersonii TaxID=4109 RepID=A0A9J5XFB2_SOLCO|nr:hypothetical protein H5410_046010 [Solanum commersonii]